MPYHPEHWARVSQDGYREGSFSMTMGYPGSTSRYLSSYGIEERYAENAIRAQVRGVKQEVMKRHMDASEAVRIKYDSKYAQSSNYWKNSIGMNKCIDSIGLISQKQHFEAELQQWQKTTGYLQGKLDFQKMADLYRQRLDVMEAYMLMSETFRRTDELSTRAQRAHNGAKPVGHGKRQHITFRDNSDTWDYDTDRETLGTLLNNYRQQLKDAQYLPAFFTEVIDKNFDGDCQAYADYLYANSLLLKKGARLYPLKKKFMKDPGVSFGFDLTEVFMNLRQQMEQLTDDISQQEHYLCDAKLRMEQDQPHYSDANFTLRLSYGQVKEYTLGGQPSGFQTKAPSLVAKMKKADSIEDYKAEPEMLTLMQQAGDMPLCFLTTNDITGGNSGSPMFDGHNRLIGLAFDGNWDSLSSDIFFDSKLARCIGVDIRYVLFMMDKWGHTERLLREMNVK